MKKIRIISLILTALLIAPIAIAGNSQRKPADNEFHVQSYDSDVDMGQFGESYKKQEGLPKGHSSDPLPSVQDRDAMLRDAKLGSEIFGWDDLDRDILFRRTRRYEITDLKAYYPTISVEKLQLLKEIIRGHAQ